MPVHKTRKRYILINWQEPPTPFYRRDLEGFLNLARNENGGVAKAPSRVVIFDQEARMGIIKTNHLLVENIKARLPSTSEDTRLPRFHIVSVSGSIKKLKSKLPPRNNKSL